MIKTIADGVYPTMITPFTKENKIDYNAVLKLIEWYVERGVNGIFAVCQSSEMFHLTFKERYELMKFVVDNTPKEINVVASGHTAKDVQTQIKEANAFIETGIDAYVFISNGFANQDESDEVFLKNYEKVVSNIPKIALGIYECPFPYKRIIQPDTLKKCSDISPLRFIKDTCCQIDLIKEKLDVVKGTGVKIYNANSATLLESLEAGCSGYSGVMANFHPEFYAWLCNNFKNEPEKSKKLAGFLSMTSVIELQQYPVNAKYHLQQIGFDIETVCRVRDDSLFTESNKKEIIALIGCENFLKSTNIFN